MTISIALATYNGARFLPQQLASLAGQTRLPDELVISDDGSTDGTLQVVEEFARRAPFPVRAQTNPRRLDVVLSSIGTARRCTGDLIAFCDQDDFWLPEKLSRCEAEFRDPGVGVVLHSSLVMTHDGKPTSIPGNRIAVTRVVEPGDYEPGAEGAAAHAMVFRRGLLDLLPEEPELLEASSGHDEWIALAAVSTCRVSFISDALVYFRQHQSNRTNAIKLRRRLMRWRYSLAVGSREMRESAELLSRQAFLAEEFASSADPRLRPALARLVQHHLGYAAQLEMRATLADRELPRSRRAALWWDHLRHGHYGRRPGIPSSPLAPVRDALRIAIR